MPALVGTAAAAAIAGGVALRSRAPGRGRFHKGGAPVRALRSTADEVAKIGKEIGKAGLRIGVGDVDMEVRRHGQDSKSRQAPLEGLLTALTSRRSEG